MTTDAVKRLGGLLGDGSIDDYWPRVKVADLRAVLDRLEAAEARIAELETALGLLQAENRIAIQALRRLSSRFGPDSAIASDALLSISQIRS